LGDDKWTIYIQVCVQKICFRREGLHLTIL
jgi:hypothetical protein